MTSESSPSAGNAAPGISAEDRVEVDIVIFGGGVAGLWLASRLKKQGFSLLLLEAALLGQGQTIWSQGIIHGGMKYALTGKMTTAAQSIAEMPPTWRKCLSGDAEPDLSAVEVLSDCQYLWTTGGLLSRVGAFAASKVLRARPRPVTPDDRPAVFRDAPPDCAVYRMNEPVVATETLLRVLAADCGDCLLKYSFPQGITRESSATGEQVIRLTDDEGNKMTITCGCVILTAGSGNKPLCELFDIPAVNMQVRPLHQVFARGDLPLIFGHAINGLSDKPRLTVTSARDSQGRVVWNIGGNIAETGIERSEKEQCEEARKELAAVLPWIDFRNVELSSGLIDRAEPAVAGGGRPDMPFVHREGNVIVAWPIKLAFAPRLHRDICDSLSDMKLKPRAESRLPALDWPVPGTALLPWEEEDRQWI